MKKNGKKFYSSKAIIDEVKWLNEKEQGQLPDIYLFKSNAVVTLNLFICSILGRIITEAPVQYVLAQVFNWSLTIFIYSLFFHFFIKNYKKVGYILNFIVLTCSSYIVYYLYTKYAIGERVIFSSFIVSFVGFILIWLAVFVMFVMAGLYETGYSNFLKNDKKILKSTLILIASCFIHIIYLIVVYGVRL